MNIPFVDPKSQYVSIKPQMDTAIQSILERTAFVMGQDVEAFERAFAEFLGVKHVIGVGAGTEALRLALEALDIGSGDEVLTVADTFIATCEAISHVGVDVRLVDANPHTYNMHPDRLEAAITPRTKAVIPVHLYRQPTDMDPILEIAHKHHLRASKIALNLTTRGIKTR